MEVKTTCPLGNECETAQDNVIHRCAWYTEIAGENPQDGEVIKEWGCAITWLPMLQIETSRTNRGQTAALESFRNETVKGQQEYLKLVEGKQELLS